MTIVDVSPKMIEDVVRKTIADVPKADRDLALAAIADFMRHLLTAVLAEAGLDLPEQDNLDEED